MRRRHLGRTATIIWSSSGLSAGDVRWLQMGRKSADNFCRDDADGWRLSMMMWDQFTLNDQTKTYKVFLADRNTEESGLLLCRVHPLLFRLQPGLGDHHLQCVEKSPPPEFFWHFIPNGWEFLFQILQAYYTFLSTLGYKFLFKYLCKFDEVMPY